MTIGLNKPTSIEKALLVLMAFSPDNEEISTTELSRQLGYHKATTSRILLTLTEHGFLRQNPLSKKFSLGRSIQILGQALTSSLTRNFVEIAKPYVETLRREVGEDVGLELWSGAGSTWIYGADTGQVLRIGSNQGRALPFHAAAGAKVMLAFASEIEIDTLLTHEMGSFTPSTITDPVIFRNHLAEIKAQGYAVDQEEVRSGLCAISAPIFNQENRAFAAVTMIVIAQRLDACHDSQQVQAVKRTAAAISARLYYNNGGTDT